MFPRLFSVLFCVIAFHSAQAVEWAVQSFELDGATIKLAMPENFAVVGDDHPVMVRTREGLPRTHRLVAGYISPEPWKYCLVQQLVSLRNWRYNARDWQQLLGSFDQSLKGLNTTELAEAFNRRAKQQTGTNGADLDLRFEKPVILPVLDSSDHHLIFPMLMAINAKVGEVEQRNVVLAACMIMALQERMVYVFLYEPFTGPETYTVLGDKAKEMARRTLEANR